MARAPLLQLSGIGLTFGGHYNPGLVIRVDYGDEPRLVGDGVPQFVEVDEAVLIHAEVRHLKSSRLQVHERFQRGIVLDLSRYEVFPPAPALGECSALYGEVITLAPAGGK